MIISVNELDDNDKKLVKQESINMRLVILGGRNAMLLEPANFSNQKRERLVDYFRDKARQNDLFEAIDKFQRIFFSKEALDADLINDNYYVAQVLGFYCAGHDYKNLYEDRFSIHMYVDNEPITAEVCEAAKVVTSELVNYAKAMKQKWEEKLHTKVSFKIERIIGYKSVLRYFRQKQLAQLFRLRKFLAESFENALGTSECLSSTICLGMKHWKDFIPHFDFLFIMFAFAVYGDGYVFPEFDGTNYNAIEKTSEACLQSELVIFNSFSATNSRMQLVE